MRNRTFLPALTLALVFGLASASAQALAVTWTQLATPIATTGPNAISAANLLEGTLTPIGTGNGSLEAFVGGPGITNPWTNDQTTNDGRDFLYVQQNAEITFDLLDDANGGVAATGGSLIWGTAGGSNTLTLFNGGELVETITTSTATSIGAQTLATNTWLVSFTDVVFDRLVFTHTASLGSYEFANLAITPIPLPAAAVLFLSGLLAMFVVGRRRNRSQIGPHSLA